jgi:hypothetical protein
MNESMKDEDRKALIAAVKDVAFYLAVLYVLIILALIFK